MAALENRRDEATALWCVDERGRERGTRTEKEKRWKGIIRLTLAVPTWGNTKGSCSSGKAVRTACGNSPRVGDNFPTTSNYLRKLQAGDIYKYDQDSRSQGIKHLSNFYHLPPAKTLTDLGIEVLCRYTPNLFQQRLMEVAF
ncbi:hypothetical protein PIB30_023286 [Stylosanthes scabra]|uniref:Uncharacterized protein n=1 Tax=Stylosanthes scabra TaxID=79078 RepID=A0ABU6Q906_9FABA|nr:hypothetical protein [Stylosanthes scabra]